MEPYQSHAESNLPTSPSEANPEPSVKRVRSQPQFVDCCRTCRRRKVKCPGYPAAGGPCSNCRRLELSCSFNESSESSQDQGSRTKPSRSHTEAGTVRKRAQRACTQCSAHKTKCTGDLPRCKRCAAADMVCEYTQAKRKFSNVELPASVMKPSNIRVRTNATLAPRLIETEDDDGGQSTPYQESTPPLAIKRDNDSLSPLLLNEDRIVKKDIVLRHVDAYFKYLYYSPCFSFLHPATTYKTIDDGRFHPSRAAAVCSVAAFFVSPNVEDAMNFASYCSSQVELYIFRNIGSLSEPNLYLYALDIVHNHFAGKPAKCWQLMAMACRLMMGLQLNWDVPGSQRSFTQQECTRRLAWHLFHFDRIYAGGFDEYICCGEGSLKITLPCTEKEFDEDKRVQGVRLTDDDPKLWASVGVQSYQIRLLNIRHHVLTMSKKFASEPAYLERARWEPSKVMEDINRLQQELSQFSTSLPEKLLLSDHNIATWLGGSEGSIYVFLHSFLGTLHIDLYRFSLPSIREKGSPELLRILPRNFLVKCQKQTVAHAISVARFWAAVNGEIASLSRNGERILAGTHDIVHCVQQVTKVLMAAKQHGLYHDLSAHSTAPLWRNEPVNGDSLRNLIDECLHILEPWSRRIPYIKPTYQKLVKSVEVFERTSRFDETSRPNIPNGPPRFPGPHYILENAFMSQDTEVDVHMTDGDGSLAAHWNGAQSAPDPDDLYAGIFAPEMEFDSEFCPPMPLYLAKARGFPAEPLCEAGDVNVDNNTLPVGDLPSGILPSLPRNTQLDGYLHATVGPSEIYQTPALPNRPVRRDIQKG